MILFVYATSSFGYYELNINTYDYLIYSYMAFISIFLIILFYFLLLKPQEHRYFIIFLCVLLLIFLLMSIIFQYETKSSICITPLYQSIIDQIINLKKNYKKSEVKAFFHTHTKDNFLNVNIPNLYYSNLIPDFNNFTNIIDNKTIEINKEIIDLQSKIKFYQNSINFYKTIISDNDINNIISLYGTDAINNLIEKFFLKERSN